MYHHLGLSVGAVDALVVRELLMICQETHTHIQCIRVDCLFLACRLSQLSAAAIASFPLVCVLALSIQNGKPLYCGKLRVSVYPIGALKDRWLTGRPMVLRRVCEYPQCIYMYPVG